MTPHASTILDRFDALDRLLVVEGQHATSSWWRDVMRDFYASGARSLVLRVGRRGGKSSTFCRLAVCEALFGEHRIPLGEVGLVGIVSIRREEAADRLRSIGAVLKLLEEPFRPVGDTIELTNRPIVFRVMTASLGGVVGGTWICGILDEVARWKDSDTGANPAKGIIASVRPTLATMPNARLIISSSPLGTLDAHYDLCELGDTPQQIVREAPTWVANPTITEADTRALEPDEVAWSREFAAIPQAEAETSLLSAVLLDRATRKEPVDLPYADGHRYVAAIDPATRGNAWTLVVGTCGADGVRRVVLVREWRGTRAQPLSPGKVFAEMRALLEPYGVRSVYSDQFSADALREAARPHKITLLIDEPWTAERKADAYEELRTVLQERRLELPPVAQVRSDLLGIRMRITRTGMGYELAKTPDGRHSDYAPALAVVVTKARVRAVPQEAELTAREKADRAKVAFLEDRRRDRERRERLGTALPVTHRRH